MALPKLNINEPIQYCDDWQVGIPLIDSQHLRLFEMMEDLRIATVSRADPAVIAKTLKGLIDYCGEHFDCEQLLMQKIGFPTYSGHLAIHQRFTDQTLRWLEDHQRGTLDPAVVVRALLEWLVSHIHESDKKITACCVAKGIDCEQFRTPADVMPSEESGDSSDCHRLDCRQLPIALVMAMMTVPLWLLLCWLCYWQHDLAGRLIAGVAGPVLLVGVYVGQLLFVRQRLHAETRRMHLAHAKQLADNLLASEIAKRVAVMNLDDIEKLFHNEASPLVGVLQEIVDNVRVYLPYIPESLLVLARGERGGSENEDAQETLQTLLPSFVPVVPSMTSEQSRNGGVDPKSEASGEVRKKSLALKVPRCLRQQRNSVKLESSEELPVAAVVHPLRNETTSSMGPLPPSKRYSTHSGDRAASSDEEGSCSKDGASRKLSDDPSQNTSSRGMASAVSIKAVGATRNLLSKWLKRKAISVMFSDVSGFHALSQRLPVEELLSLHSSYVSIVEEVAKATKGNVHRLVGDRLSLTWNAATPVGAHALQACRAAVQLRDTVAKHSEFAKVRVKISVATGTALVGNTGSKAHLSFSVIGPVMVFGSALCKLNAFLGTEILVSSNTWRDVREHFIGKIMAPIDLIVCADDPTARLEVESASESPRGDGLVASPAGVQVSILSGDLRAAGNCPSPTSAAKLCAVAAEGAEGFAELRRMFAVQLLRGVDGDTDGEWMYVLQSNEDPFKALNEALTQLFYGSYASGKSQLQAYVSSHPEDHHTADLWAACAKTSERPELTWLFGWTRP